MFLAETKHNEVKNRLILCPLFKKRGAGGISQPGIHLLEVQVHR